METRIIFCVVSLFLLASCEKTETLSLPNREIVGHWTEVEPQGIAQFEGSTYTSLLLNDDQTFRLSYRFWTDIMNPSDPCLGGVHDFHAKGEYSIEGDSIFFDGCHTDAGFGDCIGICDGDSKYVKRYAYELSPDSLVLDPRANVITRRAMIIR